MKNHKNLSKTPKTTVKPKKQVAVSNIFWIFVVFAIPYNRTTNVPNVTLAMSTCYDV